MPQTLQEIFDEFETTHLATVQTYETAKEAFEVAYGALNSAEDASQVSTTKYNGLKLSLDALANQDE